MAHENVPSSKAKSGKTGPQRDVDEPVEEVEDTEATEAEEVAVSEEIQDKAGSTHPTSSDVGKQTLTQADLGYDVTKEGVPSDEEALATPQHPDDPSADEESEYNAGMAASDK